MIINLRVLQTRQDVFPVYWPFVDLIPALGKGRIQDMTSDGRLRVERRHVAPQHLASLLMTSVCVGVLYRG